MHFFLLVLSALLIFCYMTAVFGIATRIRDNSIVDIGWGIGFILVTAFLFVSAPASTPEGTLLLVLITLWGLRLSLHIWNRSRGRGEDQRYAKWRREWGKHVILRSFFQVFMLQGAVMWVILLPVMFMLIREEATLYLPTLLPGMAIAVFGFIWEAVADLQLFRFQKDESNRGKIIRTGLWRLSRHPNYFGECMFWWGIWLMTSQDSWAILTLASPVLLSWLLLRVSGVAMLERFMTKREGYEEWVRDVPAFWPAFKKVFRVGSKRQD